MNTTARGGGVVIILSEKLFLGRSDGVANIAALKLEEGESPLSNVNKQ